MSEPAINAGIDVVLPAARTASPTVIGLSDVFWMKSSPTKRSSQIWMNCKTVTVAIAGTAIGQDQSPHRAEVAEAVDDARLDEFIGHAAEVRREEEDRERRAERGVDEDRAGVAAGEMQSRHVHELGHQDRLERHHHRAHDDEEDDGRHAKAQLREREAGRQSDAQDDEDRRRADDGRAEQLLADRDDDW